MAAAFPSVITVQAPITSIPLQRISLFLCTLPLFSFVSCVLIALVWHFDDTTKTHCQVPNYLPSISAAIGGNMPEMFIWRVAIALHCFPRILLLPSAIHKHYTNTQSGRIYHLTTWWFKPLNFLNYILEIIENGALLSMTYISSVENHAMHEASFIVFMVCSMSYMFLSCILSGLTASKPMSKEDSSLFRKKVFAMIFNYFSFGMAVYFFFRHNWYCEPGVYTLFALGEYCTVLSNVAFHWHCSKHFNGAVLMLTFVEDMKVN
ncbi:post-GPI attachment to proteins factor 2-like [Pocillopora damicornis]|uniref:post-GPI attachment to proteins factor 2-like n=1 Tax=Pocillopora damicornis TaxID=46731 RepID=UPI000F5584E0|nr:post-GPI attachment to proteins factor 2-like [Pocillopora damicornis]